MKKYELYRKVLIIMILLILICDILLVLYYSNIENYKCYIKRRNPLTREWERYEGKIVCNITEQRTDNYNPYKYKEFSVLSLQIP